MKRLVQIFSENKDKIINNWGYLTKEKIHFHDNDEFYIIKNGFCKLLNSFITHLSENDRNSYYLSNAEIAKEVAVNDISYKNFIDSFHYFEASYIPILSEKLEYPELVKYLIDIDEIHHGTIAIISEEYFSIMDSTVNALVKLTELRDGSTGTHLERTREYLSVLGKELGLEKGELNALCKAGPLHDIGKVGIRDSILLKPCALNKEEFEEMKQHTVIGSKVIDEILGEKYASRGFLKIARCISLYHHEKYDGSGYPDGLIGEKIPFEARLFALVDAYDAIVSRRPYKEPLSHEEAFKRITLDSGKHFDPQIVNAFLKVQIQFRDISLKNTV